MQDSRAVQPNWVRAMAHCPVCARELPNGVDSCPDHAGAVSSETPTLEARGRPAEALVQERPRGRFVPGTLLGGRYRVVALLGPAAWARSTGRTTCASGRPWR